MGKTTGFLEYDRVDGPVRGEQQRTQDFQEFHSQLPLPAQQEQAGRCMDCGVPFCQGGVMIAGMASGCPLHNLVPEVNDLVCKGRMEQAYRRLSITHSFPEFTCRVCPALCEAACTCGVHDAPVSTKENEKAVIEYAFSHGLVEEKTSPVRTGKKVAVIGSGPSGLAAAQLLNHRGHEVTVYERKDRVGGLLRYGIPNMKLDKAVIDRRIALMEKAGVRFVTGVDVGTDIKASVLEKEYDSIILACGASNPRDIRVPGRDAKGIYFAVDFLGTVTKHLLDENLALPQSLSAETDKKSGKHRSPGRSEKTPRWFVSGDPVKLVYGKDVIVIGGGDTGNDCVGTCIRLGAKSVTQLEMMPKPSDVRMPSNPWPEWPKILKTDYGQEEAIWKFGADPRVYQTTVKEFIVDKNGNVKQAVLVLLTPEKDEKTGRTMMVPVEGSERTVSAGLILIAAGFLGSEKYVTDAFEVATDGRSNVKTAPGSHATSKPEIFTAGDMHRGQSLVVWAIAEGRSAAREVDEALMGYTNL